MHATSQGPYATDVGTMFDQALRDGATEMSVERVFAGALGAGGRWREVCDVAGLDRRALRTRVLAPGRRSRPRRGPAVVRSDASVQAVLERAGREARTSGASEIEPAHVLLSLLAEPRVRDTVEGAPAAERALRAHLARGG